MPTVNDFSKISGYSIPLTQLSISFYIKRVLKTPNHLLPLFAKFHEQLQLITDKRITYVMDYKVLTMSLKLPSTYWYIPLLLIITHISVYLE
jgi:hypothetical protein